nr:MAG TPA: hypothetical protein [Caudoviricetes sp.]
MRRNGKALLWKHSKGTARIRGEKQGHCIDLMGEARRGEAKA